MKFRNILFDVDGTLINTTTANLMGLQDLLTMSGKKSYSFDELMKYEGIPGCYTLKALGFENIREAQRQWGSLIEHRKYMFEYYYGIQGTLSVLKSAGFGLGIVTSRTSYEVENDPLLTALKSFFRSIITADHTDKHKPNPDPLIYAMNINGFNPSETVYIGDTIHDYEAAKRANIKFIKAEWGGMTFDVDGEHYQAKTPIELLKLVSEHGTGMLNTRTERIF